MNLLTLISLIAMNGRLRRQEGWSRQRLQSHQADAFQRLRGHAYAHSPFYRRFHRGFTARPLSELPVLTKAVMMENFDDLVTDRDVHHKAVEEHLAAIRGDERFLGRYRVNATSGSTGRQGLFLFDRREWITALATFLRPYEWLAGPTYIPPRIRVAAIASPTPWHMSRRAGATLATRLVPTLSLSASDPPETIVARLNDWQPQVLVTYPSIARILANEQLAGRLAIQPRHILTGAEVLTADTRRRGEEAWGPGRLSDVYGATEGGTLAAECGHHQGLHLFEDLVIFEVVDRYNRPVPPGVYGEKLLITVLFGRTQPLIRYELSDSLRLADRPCPCGRPFTLVTGIQGRREDILRFPATAGGEVAINPVVFDQVLDRIPAGEWQVVQERDGLSILLAGTPEGFADEALAAELSRGLAAQGAVPPPIRIQHVAAIPRGATGKAPLITSQLPSPDKA